MSNFKAKFTQRGKDLFWEYITPTEYIHKNGECKVLVGEIMTWTGYDDDYWWESVSVRPEHTKQADGRGNIWQINYRTGNITLYREAELQAA